MNMNHQYGISRLYIHTPNMLCFHIVVSVYFSLCVCLSVSAKYLRKLNHQVTHQVQLHPFLVILNKWSPIVDRCGSVVVQLIALYTLVRKRSFGQSADLFHHAHYLTTF